MKEDYTINYCYLTWTFSLKCWDNVLFELRSEMVEWAHWRNMANSNSQYLTFMRIPTKIFISQNNPALFLSDCSISGFLFAWNESKKKRPHLGHFLHFMINNSHTPYWLRIIAEKKSFPPPSFVTQPVVSVGITETQRYMNVSCVVHKFSHDDFTDNMPTLLCCRLRICESRGWLQLPVV